MDDCNDGSGIIAILFLFPLLLLVFFLLIFMIVRPVSISYEIITLFLLFIIIIIISIIYYYYYYYYSLLLLSSPRSASSWSFLWLLLMWFGFKLLIIKIIMNIYAHTSP